RPWKFASGMQPLKHFEQFACMAHVEAGAVVADEEYVLALAYLGGDLDPGDLAVARILQCVGKQVQEHLPEQFQVTTARWQVAEHDVHRAPLLLVRKIL